MSNVQQTSLLAYKEAKQKLNQKQNIVLYTLQLESLCSGGLINRLLSLKMSNRAYCEGN